ncbi:hypothetical protein [Pectobacterium sp. IFB5596]|uniref:hypothetical protein n=1 Tax=Pectobacterium sp. IFB5596 TaxID=1839803 RepID=UPI001F3808F3|nr:hypothetical protein [Pectobacterium sp. IFB5596]MCE9733859.1 hypothetical protein [Pectobacterium sp. IFB5596]
MFGFLKKIFSNPSNQSSDTTSAVDSMGNYIYEDNLDLDSYPFKMVNQKAILWNGIPVNVEFSYLNDLEKKERIQGKVQEIAISEKGEFILQVNVEGDDITHSIEEKHIETKILVGTVRFNFKDFCKQKLKINTQEMFSYAKAVRHAASTLTVTKEIPPILTSFTYVKNKERYKTETLIDRMLENKHGFASISGKNPKTGERDDFDIQKIDTMIKSEGHNKYNRDEWIKVIFGISDK